MYFTLNGMYIHMYVGVWITVGPHLQNGATPTSPRLYRLAQTLAVQVMLSWLNMTPFGGPVVPATTGVRMVMSEGEVVMNEGEVGMVMSEGEGDE